MLLLNLILLIEVTFSTPTPDNVNCRRSSPANRPSRLSFRGTMLRGVL